MTYLIIYLLGVLVSIYLLQSIYKYQEKNIKERIAKEIYYEDYENCSEVVDSNYDKAKKISLFIISWLSWLNFVILVYYVVKQIRTGSML